MVFYLYNPKTMMIYYGVLLLAYYSDYWFLVLRSYNPRTMMIYCPTVASSNSPEYMVFHWFLVLRSYDPKIMMIYCPTAVATVMNIWCSFGS